MSKYNLMYLKILEVTDFPLLAIIALVTTFTSVNWVRPSAMFLTKIPYPGCSRVGYILDIRKIRIMKSQ